MKALLILVLAFVLMSKMLFRSNLIKLHIFTINLKLSTAFSFILIKSPQYHVFYFRERQEAIKVCFTRPVQ